MQNSWCSSSSLYLFLLLCFASSPPLRFSANICVHSAASLSIDTYSRPCSYDVSLQLLLLLQVHNFASWSPDLFTFFCTVFGSYDAAGLAACFAAVSVELWRVFSATQDKKIMLTRYSKPSVWLSRALLLRADERFMTLSFNATWLACGEVYWFIDCPLHRPGSYLLVSLLTNVLSSLCKKILTTVLRRSSDVTITRRMTRTLEDNWHSWCYSFLQTCFCLSHDPNALFLRILRSYLLWNPYLHSSNCLCFCLCSYDV